MNTQSISSSVVRNQCIAAGMTDAEADAYVIAFASAVEAETQALQVRAGMETAAAVAKVTRFTGNVVGGAGAVATNFLGGLFAAMRS
jgi:hypothetical protein